MVEYHPKTFHKKCILYIQLYYQKYNSRNKKKVATKYPENILKRAIPYTYTLVACEDFVDFSES